MTTDCLFCKMIAGQIPINKAGETDQVLAFHDIAPQAPIHVLVIHKTHTANITETADNAIFAELMGGVRDITDQLMLKDFRLVINNGVEAGQTVFHLHAHILAGRSLPLPPC